MTSSYFRRIIWTSLDLWNLRTSSIILAIVDEFTKFCWLYPTKTTAAIEITTILKTQSMTFGNPTFIISDWGAAFTYEVEGIKHHGVTTGLPRANGQVKRLNAIIWPVLAKLAIDDPCKWYKFVDKVQQNINSRFCRSTQKTPFELLIGNKMRTKADVDIQKIIHDEIIQKKCRTKINIHIICDERRPTHTS